MIGGKASKWGLESIPIREEGLALLPVRKKKKNMESIGTNHDAGKGKEVEKDRRFAQSGQNGGCIPKSKNDAKGGLNGSTNPSSQGPHENVCINMQIYGDLAQ